MSTLILRQFVVRVPALSMRAKVSHSWLDHEIAMVSEELALARWKSLRWGIVERRWVALHDIARQLGESMYQFKTSYLVELLPAFQMLSAFDREDLRQRLDDLPEVRFDNAEEKYVELLGILWDCSKSFFDIASDHNAEESKVVVRWRKIRTAAHDLKCMFELGEIPNGVILP